VGNLAPDGVAAPYAAVADGKLAAGRRLHDELFDLNRAIFLDTNPIPLKYMMWRAGLLPSAEVRLPLVAIGGIGDDRGSRLDDVRRRAGLMSAQAPVARRTGRGECSFGGSHCRCSPGASWRPHRPPARGRQFAWRRTF